MPCDHWNLFRSSPEIAQLAEDLATKPAGEWTDADERLTQWLHHEPDRALSTICAIAKITDDVETLSVLAAGPLEDFLGIHGAEYFDTIRALAHDHPRFHAVLCGVWQGA